MENVTHNVVVNTRIDKVCDKESSRYALGHVHVRSKRNPDNGAWLTATDGRILAIVESLGSEAPTQALMPMEIAAGATGSKPIKAQLNGRWENSKGKFAQHGEGRFPAADKVLESIDLNGTFLRIDAKLLANLAAGLNDIGETSCVTLIIGPDRDDDNHVSRGVAVVGDRGIGVIMPCAGLHRNPAEGFKIMAAEYCEDCHDGWAQFPAA